LTDVWAHGGEGGIDLAEKIASKTESTASATKDIQYIYELEDSLETKIKKVAHTVYGAQDIELSPTAKQQIAFYENEGWGRLPVFVDIRQHYLSYVPSRL